jgi:hypothetical protein
VVVVTPARVALVRRLAASKAKVSLPRAVRLSEAPTLMLVAPAVRSVVIASRKGDPSH